jgi:hypothetical protein
MVGRRKRIPRALGQALRHERLLQRLGDPPLPVQRGAQSFLPRLDLRGQRVERPGQERHLILSVHRHHWISLVLTENGSSSRKPLDPPP